MGPQNEEVQPSPPTPAAIPFCFLVQRRATEGEGWLWTAKNVPLLDFFLLPLAVLPAVFHPASFFVPLVVHSFKS